MDDPTNEHDPEQSEQSDQPNAGPGEQRTDSYARELLTYRDAGARLGLTPDAVRMQCRRGKLVCEEVEGRRLVIWPQPEREETGEVREPVSPRTVSTTVRPDALQTRVAILEANLLSTERERVQWQSAYTQQSDRLDKAIGLADGLRQDLAAERQRVDHLQLEVGRLKALPAPEMFANRSDSEPEAVRSSEQPHMPVERTETAHQRVDPPRVGDSSSRGGSKRSWWRFWTD